MSKRTEKAEAPQDYEVVADGAFEIAGATLRKGDAVSLLPSVARAFGGVLKARRTTIDAASKA